MTLAKAVANTPAAIPADLLDSLMSSYRKPEDLSGENWLLKQITKAFVERALQAEMEDHLYPPEIRKVIYTTNAIESVNMGLRKVSKSQASFPSDEALLKRYYLALKNIGKKWTMPIRDWKAALNRFTIQFEDRMPQQF